MIPPSATCCLPSSVFCESALTSGDDASARLVDVGCFILRGNEFVAADPLVTARCLNRDAQISHAAGDGEGEAIAAQQGLVLLENVAPGLWGVLVAMERFASGACAQSAAAGNSSVRAECVSVGKDVGNDTNTRTSNGLCPTAATQQQLGGSSRYRGTAAAEQQQQGGWADELDEFDDGGVVSCLFLVQNGHMQMQQAELQLLRSLPWQTLPNLTVHVSSGQLGIFSKQSMEDIQAANRGLSAGLQETTERVSHWFNRACEVTCSEQQVGILDAPGGPVGCVSATGLAEEGVYSFQVVRSEESGEIWAVKVEFFSTAAPA